MSNGQQASRHRRSKYFARGQFDHHEGHPSRSTRQRWPCCALTDKGQTEPRLLAGATWTDTGLVFTREDGHAMQSEQPMKRALATASESAPLATAP
jgi:hypothetical protein